MKSIFLWKEIIPSPVKGFSTVTGKTKIAVPLLVVILIAAAGSFILLPVITSDSYSKALVRVQTSILAERGTEMSAEQTEQLNEQLSSGSMRKVNSITTIGGAIFVYVLMIFFSVLILKLICIIFREKPEFRLLLRIIIFIAIFSAVQMLLKNLITAVSDYNRILSRVQTSEDLQWALNSPVSLAVLFSPSSLNNTLYTLIDTVTDIFNWLYYGYLYAALRGAAELKSSRALAVTLVFAALSIGVSLLMTAVV